MAKIVTKIGLACILWKFNVTFSSEESFKKAPKFQNTQFFLRVGELFDFKVSRRN
jgi:hypothetical protein